MRAALEALELWARQRDLSNEFVVLEAAGINLNELGWIEASAVVLGSLERGRRRMLAVQGDPHASEWIDCGAAMSRTQLLAFTKVALSEALATD